MDIFRLEALNKAALSASRVAFGCSLAQTYLANPPRSETPS